MRWRILSLALIIVLVAITSSCAFKSLGSPKDLKNHALESNGAMIRTVTGRLYRYYYYSGGDYTYAARGVEENPQHSLETLINGNCCSEDWIDGEGWECGYDCVQTTSRYYYRGDERGSIITIIIEFPTEVQLNRVIVHTIDNEEYPSSDYGVSDMTLRCLAEDDVWIPVELVGTRRKYPGY